MTPPPTGLDMDYDPEEDDSGERDRDIRFAGAVMLLTGFIGILVLSGWDWFGASAPSKGTYGIIGLWLLLGACVRVAEVYR